MAIKRNYQEPVPDPNPIERISIGRLRVGIDDLAALMDLLKERDPTQAVHVAFDEGIFDSPEDLRSLSEANLRDLKVHAGNLVVHLRSTYPMIIGPRDSGRYVYNQWARSRQYKSVTFRDMYPSGVKDPHVLMVVAMLLFAAYLGASRLLDWIAPPAASGLAIALGLFAAAVLFVGISIYRDEKKTPQVQIIPHTRDEIRNLEAGKSSVPTWSLVVAVLALVVSIFFNVLNYLKPN